MKKTILSALLFGLFLPVNMYSGLTWAKNQVESSDVTERRDQASAMTKASALVRKIPSATEIAADLGASSFRRYTFSLKQLGASDPFQLNGTDSVYSLPFSIPSDEVITSLKLNLTFAYSPSLITNLSHFKVLVNGELADTISLPKEQAGMNLSREIILDPRTLTDFNKISLQFIGHYTLGCEDPYHSSLWFNVSNLSTLEFTATPLSVQNDLALLPAPFFDRRDNKKLELPFVFGGAPSTGVLEAAGIVSSWFGALASYRGAWFPASLNVLPVDDIVVFATNDERPSGLEIPTINGPTLAVAPHPGDSKFKILYVLGRDQKELRTAATALGLSRNTFSGQTVAITGVENLKARKPYDAPNWTVSDRPVKFGEINTNEALNTAGLQADAIRINLRIPPDLFGWQSKGMPVDLKYRYTPRPQIDKSTLNVNVNQNFINAFPMLPFPEFTQTDTVSKRLMSVLSKDGLLPGEQNFSIPLTLLPTRGQLQFHFNFDSPKQGDCKDITIRRAHGGVSDVMMPSLQGSIDPNSTFDLSSFPHYLQMPNLAVFANAGFPFTKMADLSETIVIIPDTPASPDIGTFLTLMGRMGESTGLPAYGVSVGRAADIQKFSDKDILLLGSSSNQPMLTQWGKHMSFSVAGLARSFSLTDWIAKTFPWYEVPPVDGTPVVKLSEITLNKEAVIVGFESPLKPGRSVVAIVSDKTSGLADVLSALMDNELISKIQGSLTVVRGKEVDSMTVGDTYHVGSLAAATKLRWLLASNAWAIGLLLIIGAILMGAVAYTLLRLRVLKRTKG